MQNKEDNITETIFFQLIYNHLKNILNWKLSHLLKLDVLSFSKEFSQKIQLIPKQLKSLKQNFFWKIRLVSTKSSFINKTKISKKMFPYWLLVKWWPLTPTWASGGYTTFVESMFFDNKDLIWCLIICIILKKLTPKI